MFPIQKKFFDPAVQLTTNKIIGNKGAEYIPRSVKKRSNSILMVRNPWKIL